jgi:hypothetical protein
MPLVLAGATSGSTTIQATDATTQTITLPANSGTVLTTASTFGGTGPAFSAYQSSNQTGISSSVYTKIIFQTKEYDTNSNFDNSTNYRFTPTVAGYYQINAGVAWLTGYSTAILSIYKNGSAYKDGVSLPTATNRSTVNAIVYCNGSTDYVEIYGYQSSGGSGSIAAAINYTYFQAAMIRSA